MNKLIVSSSPHIGTRDSIPKIMWTVAFALMPALAMAIYNWGVYPLIVVIVSTLVAIASELIVNLYKRYKEKKSMGSPISPITAFDGSAAVTGILFAFNLPPYVPLYVPIIGSIFAILMIKQLFGGLGYNIVNPALAARVFVMFAWLPLITGGFTLPYTWERINNNAKVIAIAKYYDKNTKKNLISLEEDIKGLYNSLKPKIEGFYKYRRIKGKRKKRYELIVNTAISNYVNILTMHMATLPTIDTNKDIITTVNNITGAISKSMLEDVILNAKYKKYDRYSIYNIKEINKFEKDAKHSIKYFKEDYTKRINAIKSVNEEFIKLILLNTNIKGNIKKPFKVFYNEIGTICIDERKDVASLPSIDSITSATPLQVQHDHLKVGGKTAKDMMDNITMTAGFKKGREKDSEFYLRLFVGLKGGVIGEVSPMLLLLGAIILFIRRIITYHIPLYYLLTVAIIAWVFGDYRAGLFSGDVLFHLLSGGLFLGAFFMATDMVTTPITRRGQIIFAIGCGIITMIIRLWGGYPEGVSFSILFMNLMVPLIDRWKWTIPRVYGKGSA